MQPTPAILDRVRSAAKDRPRERLDLETLAGMRRAIEEVLREQTPLLAKVVADAEVEDGERRVIGEALDRVARYYEVVLGFEPEPSLAGAHGRLLQALELEATALEAVIAGERGLALETSEAARKRVEEAFPETAGAKGDAPTLIHDAAERVYDRTTGRSRYDAREEALLTFRLRCPRESCGRPGDYRLKSGHSTHRVTCPSCHGTFTVYVATVADASREVGVGSVRHRIETRDPDGTGRTLRFDEVAQPPGMPVEPRDLVVVTYDEDGRLRLVRNYSRGAEVWVAPRPRCFVATVALPPGAPELEVLRRFRDEVLLASVLGRAMVGVYEVAGPPLAGVVEDRPALRRIARGLALAAAHRIVAARPGPAAPKAGR